MFFEWGQTVEIENMVSKIMSHIIPYGKQTIEDSDIQAVVEALSSDWLTTGPAVDSFERAFADFVQTKYAVAVANGTAALHAAMYALEVGFGDEVIVPAMTFAASANCVVMQGGTPVFVDVDPETLLIDPAVVEAKISPRTKAIIAVDYAGQSCDYDALYAIARKRGLAIVDDACHALGGSYRGRNVGSLADLNTFSLHPVKNMTTGEGGVITTNDANLAQRMRLFRNHGISSSHRDREANGSWVYEMVDLGCNYRLTDFQCALGISQLKRLPAWISRRRSIAHAYDEAFKQLDGVQPLHVRADVDHAYHLYVVQIAATRAGRDREGVYKALRSNDIGVNVHYIPVHLHPYYRRTLNTVEGMCPVAEAAYERILSLPIYPGLTEQQQRYVVSSVIRATTDKPSLSDMERTQP